jgi:hypothetical protein
MSELRVEINPVTGGTTVGYTVGFDPNPLNGYAGDNAFWFNSSELSLYLTPIQNGQPKLPPLWTPEPIAPGTSSGEIGLDPNNPASQAYTIAYAAVTKDRRGNYQTVSSLTSPGTINIAPQP